MFITGNQGDMDRIKDKIGSVKNLRVNLGKWRVPLNARTPAEHFPCLQLLQKALLWTDPQFSSLRAMLAKPPLKTGSEAIGTKMIQVRVQDTRTRMQCWNGTDGVPKECAGLPFKHAVIDLRNKSIKFVEDMEVIPGLSLMQNLPVCLIGNLYVVVAMKEKLYQLWGPAREDVSRIVDVYTNEADTHFMYARRALCLMLPTAFKFPKV